MTYKTRQEVLRAAADLIDVCENAVIVAMCKVDGYMMHVSECSFMQTPNLYEFPLAILEGKEVWVGSELYWDDGSRVTVTEAWNINANWKLLSWNKPKPATVMVEMPMRLAEFRAGRIELNNDEHDALLLAEDDACKKALEKL